MKIKHFEQGYLNKQILVGLPEVFLVILLMTTKTLPRRDLDNLRVTASLSHFVLVPEAKTCCSLERFKFKAKESLRRILINFLDKI